MAQRETQSKGFQVDELLREQSQSALQDLAPRFEGFCEAVLLRLDDDSDPEYERVLRTDDVSEDERLDAGLIDNEAFEMIGGYLREEVHTACEGLDWAAFSQGITDGIDAEASMVEVGALLKANTGAETAGLDWASFSQGISDGIDAEVSMADTAMSEVRPLLRAEALDEQGGLDWAAFSQGIMDGIEAEEAQPAIAAALREQASEAVAAREGQWDQFSAGVMASLPAETVTVAELLGEETEAELATRDGEWNAFSARVFEAVDAEERLADKAPLEAQAILQMKSEVGAEVEALSPKFGEDFKRGVEKEIFRSAQQPESWWSQAWSWVQETLQGGMGPGFMAAAAAAVVLIMVTGLPDGEQSVPQIAAAGPSGQVAVQQISFEGDVTVMPEEGVTVVWLHAPS